MLFNTVNGKAVCIYYELYHLNGFDKLASAESSAGVNEDSVENQQFLCVIK